MQLNSSEIKQLLTEASGKQPHKSKIMVTPKVFFKSTEAIIVLSGLFMTVTHGRFWAYVTAAAYVGVNLAAWIKAEYDKN